MVLKDVVELGMSLPHRSPDPVGEYDGAPRRPTGGCVGVPGPLGDEQHRRRIESFDSWTVLTYAAALTTRIRLGVSVMVLPTYHPVHVAHVVATLDRRQRRTHDARGGASGGPRSTSCSRCRPHDGSGG